MFVIMITCPTTGVKVSTGVCLDGSRWNSEQEFQAYIRCPVCGADHEWSAKDVTPNGDIEIRQDPGHQPE